ncbi:hypothetical protein F442_10921 [Phytophthora nicotianae P10297]|uniref:SWIM-type domain-containing protein n=1 Tax=Phytophthora nicotianae P10297 TaxID=1317064 RepID=W2Z529_PHYNI|nr:hypothetical protein F442_10921 [Phytophthora nicotianae P10297]
MLSNKEILAIVKTDINLMHRSTSYKYFNTLSTALVQRWRVQGEQSAVRQQNIYISRQRSLDQLVTGKLAKRLKTTRCTGFSLTSELISPKMEALPEVRTSVVATFRSKYSCECKAYISSGWICSHELVAAAINRHLNLAEVQAGIPHRRLPGRPRKELNSLI